MYYRNVVSICFLLAMSFGTRAQKIISDPAIYFSGSQIDSIAALIPGSEKPSRLLGSSSDKESYLIVVRTKEGDAEIHEQFDDVAMIKSGSGILKMGSELKGGKMTETNGAREWLGGIIIKPTERKIKAGDFIVIPSSIAHQFIPDKGSSLIYYVIKVRHLKS